MGVPTEIPASYLYNISPSGTTVSSYIGAIEPGMLIPAIDGSRLYYGTAGYDCIYIQAEVRPEIARKLGGFYTQDKTSFIMDTGHGGLAGAASKRLTATKSVLKDFLDIYMGVMTVAGGPVAYSIAGMNILVATGKIKQNYSSYRDALEALVDNKMYFYNAMPIFYETIMGELLFGSIERDLTDKGKDLLSNAVPGPKVAGKLVGVFLGKIGEDRLAKRLGAIKKLINDVLIKVADHMISKKEPISEEQVKLLSVHHVIPTLKEAEIVIEMLESRSEQIIRETARNAAGVRPRLQKISKAIGALSD